MCSAMNYWTYNCKTTASRSPSLPPSLWLCSRTTRTPGGKVWTLEDSQEQVPSISLPPVQRTSMHMEILCQHN